MERRLSADELWGTAVPSSTGLLQEKQSLDEQAPRGWLGEHFRRGMSSTEEIPSGELQTAHLGSDFQVVLSHLWTQ